MSNIFSLTLPDTLLQDKSVTILNQITGLAYHLIDPKNDFVETAFSKMMMHFNEALLGFGLLIFAILLFVGTMNTAADGQFLGRNWNSVWTPIRLILGVLFVVPLKTGFCVAQYLFLYLILIGVSIGTYVWDEVVKDIFSQYTPPAIPSYIANYAQIAVENQMLYMSMDPIMKNALGLTSGSAKIELPVKYTANAGELPLNIVTLMNKNLGPTICPKLYTDTSIQAGCRKSIAMVLNGGQLNGLQQDGITGFDGSIQVWIGTNLLDKGLNSIVNPNGYRFNESNLINADGKVNVEGSYTYTFDLKNNNGSGKSSVANNMNEDLKKRLYVEGDQSTFIPSFILNISKANTENSNLCLDSNKKSNGKCSLAGMSNTVIAAAQKSIQADNQKRIDGGASGKGCRDTAEGTVCDIDPSQTYIAKGMPKTKPNGDLELDKDGNQVYDEFEVPLIGSWWNAGQAYLILDDHFSRNLQVLIQAIQSNTIEFLGATDLTGTMTATTKVMVLEAGAEFRNMQNGKVPNSDDDRVKSSLYHCFPADATSTSAVKNGDPLTCGFGSAMLYPATISTSTTTAVNMAELGGTGSWGMDIAPYNPKIEKLEETKDTATDINFYYKRRVTQSTQAFYNQLLAIPPSFQVPLQLLLTAARDQSAPGKNICPDDNCYVKLYPYLVNIVNVLAANGLLLNNQSDSLPINQAMNSMFTQLIGKEDANDVRVRSINSIMQDVYKFGIDKQTDIIKQQFSLIQQVRDTGIGMVVACLGSIETVYTHFRVQMQNMTQEVLNATTGDMAKASLGLAYGSAGLYSIAGGVSMAGNPIATGIGTGIGLLGQAAATTSQILQSQVELSIATTTITTLSNIGVQMMWLPLFMFVISSLFTAGVQFALVIPFMPYIMFWAGQIAWVIGVLEAMVAAPLVMLAFAHPGGSEHMGHAAPAVRFLIGIIFRPVLMVIGLIIGILLTYILIHYSAEGFHIIAGSVFNAMPAGNTMFMGVMSCILLFSYASFLVMAFTKCFSPIYVIPEKVVQWINGHAEAAGAQESQQFASGTQQTAQQGAQAGGSTLQAGVQAQKDKGQQMSELHKQEFTQGAGGMGAASKISEGAGQTGSSMMQFGNAKATANNKSK